MAILPIAYLNARSAYQQVTASSPGTPQAGSVFQPSESAAKKEIAGLNNAVTQLQSALNAFSPTGALGTMYEEGQLNSIYDLQMTGALKNLVNAYNEVNESLKTSGYLNSAGNQLLRQLEGLLQGPDGEKWRELGLTMDEGTGSLSFDKYRFASVAVDDRAAAWRQLAGGDRSVVSVLNDLASVVMSKQVKSYFTSTFTASV